MKNHLYLNENDIEWKESSTFDKGFTKVLLRAEESESFAVLLQTVKPNGRVPSHSHKEDSFYYIISGCGKLYLGEDRVDIVPGLAVYIPSWEVHGIDNNGSSPIKYIEIKNYVPS